MSKSQSKIEGREAPTLSKKKSNPPYQRKMTDKTVRRQPTQGAPSKKVEIVKSSTSTIEEKKEVLTVANSKQFQEKQHKILPKVCYEGVSNGCSCDICMIKKDPSTENDRVVEKRMFAEWMEKYNRDKDEGITKGTIPNETRDGKPIRHLYFRTHSFNWLVDKLVTSPDNKFYGCEVNMTETAILENGRARKVVKTNKDGFLQKEAANLPAVKLCQIMIQACTDRSKLICRKKRELRKRQKQAEREARRQRQLEAMEAQGIDPASLKVKLPSSSLYGSGQKSHNSPSQRSIGRNSDKGFWADKKNKTKSGTRGAQKDEIQALLSEGNSNVLAVESEEEDTNEERRQNELDQEDLKRFYQDAVIYRFERDKDEKYATKKQTVLSEKQFYDDTKRKKADSDWTKVNSVAMVPISKHTMGQQIGFTFFAPTNKPRDIAFEMEKEQKEKMTQYLKNKRRQERMAKGPPVPNNESIKEVVAKLFAAKREREGPLSDSEEETEIKLKARPPVNKNIDTYDFAERSYLDDVVFDYRQFGSDDTFLQENAPEIFCIKQCYKIGYYLQKLHGIDLLRMDVEFLRDDFREIFFFAADNIIVREQELFKGQVQSRERAMKQLLLKKIANKIDDIEEIDGYDLDVPVEARNEREARKKGVEPLKGLGDEKLERGVRTYMSDLFDRRAESSPVKEKKCVQYQDQLQLTSKLAKRNQALDVAIKQSKTPKRGLYPEKNRVSDEQVKQIQAMQKKDSKHVFQCHSINKARIVAGLEQETRERRAGTASASALRQPHSRSINTTRSVTQMNINPQATAFRLPDAVMLTPDSRIQYETIRRMLIDSTYQHDDCADNRPTEAFKTMMSLKTKCPVLTQEQVIEAIKTRASKGQIQMRKHREFLKKLSEVGGKKVFGANEYNSYFGQGDRHSRESSPYLMMHQQSSLMDIKEASSQRNLKSTKQKQLTSSFKGSHGGPLLQPASSAYPHEMSRSVPRVSNYNPSMRVFPTNIGFSNDSPLYMPNKQIVRRYGEGSLVLIRPSQSSLETVDKNKEIDLKKQLSAVNNSNFKSRYDQTQNQRNSNTHYMAKSNDVWHEGLRASIGSERNLTSAASSALVRFYDRQRLQQKLAQKRMDSKNMKFEPPVSTMRTGGTTDITPTLNNDYLQDGQQQSREPSRHQNSSFPIKVVTSTRGQHKTLCTMEVDRSTDFKNNERSHGELLKKDPTLQRNEYLNYEENSRPQTQMNIKSPHDGLE